VTTVEGLSPELDLKRIVKAIRKKFCCQGIVKTDEAKGTVALQVSGDQRENIKQWLIAEGLATEQQIRLHGG
jgi:translation initiation factor 1